MVVRNLSFVEILTAPVTSGTMRVFGMHAPLLQAAYNGATYRTR